jgi:hypothetical protein
LIRPPPLRWLAWGCGGLNQRRAQGGWAAGTTSSYHHSTHTHSHTQTHTHTHTHTCHIIHLCVGWQGGVEVHTPRSGLREGGQQSPWSCPPKDASVAALHGRTKHEHRCEIPTTTYSLPSFVCYSLRPPVPLRTASAPGQQHFVKHLV